MVMKLMDILIYRNDVARIANVNLPWDKLYNKSVMITGATGLIGSFLVDVLMYRNIKYDMQCNVVVLGRNKEKAMRRFDYCNDSKLFSFIEYDIYNDIEYDGNKKIDMVLHLASNTHPVLYSTDPIGTIAANVIGLKNMLDFSAANNAERVLFASSNEIYGENRGDTELFDENYCGYIDCNTLRAGYTESKRCGEALCQAYIKQKGLDIVIARLTRSYGPTMLMSDTKAISQFIKKAVNGDDIVLKSSGTQYYSYTYVADAVSGLLTVLLKGTCGEAYNIADIRSDIMLKDLAAVIAETVSKKVVFELPDDVEAAGYSKATKARLNGGKLQQLGWHADYNINDGIKNTIEILKELCGINQISGTISRI